YTCILLIYIYSLFFLFSLTHHLSYYFLFILFIKLPQPPQSTLFPYTTLFRSHAADGDHAGFAGIGGNAGADAGPSNPPAPSMGRDRKSTRLNSSHVSISYAVFCLKKKIYCIQMTKRSYK